MNKSKKKKLQQQTIKVLTNYLETTNSYGKVVVDTESEDKTKIGLLWTPLKKEERQGWFQVDEDEGVLRIVLEDYGYDFLHGDAMFDEDVSGGDRDNFEENYLSKIGDKTYYYEPHNNAVWHINL
tara:strand:+ start:1589 stop:1963 length:375 start_codon:yes stop_codon:yes gene_type:complete